MGFDLPANAQQVRGGALFKVYTWEQRMFDGRTEIFESVVQEDAVMMIIVEGDNIIIAHEQQPHVEGVMHWLVGGRLPRGKNPLQHAKEELLEETGMVSNDIALWGVQEKDGVHKRKWLYYIVKNAKVVAEQNLDPGGEKIELVRLSFDEFIEHVLEKGIGGLWLKCKIQEMMLEGTLEEFRESLFSGEGVKR